jgi:2-polyprenyl-3-methyl-5-hydroxy-6-metoxy-1,4-benzoquinol methylase
MIYVATIEDCHALVFDGPVYGKKNGKILTSSNLEDIKGSWEFRFFPDREIEWSAFKKNANEALHRIGLHFEKSQTENKVFDFGSGWGFFLAAAQEEGWTGYGLEPLPASAVYARASFGLNIVTDTLRENTFPSNFFDVITSFQVFEHLPCPKENLLSLHKMLRPNGIILIEVPNYDTWSMRLMRSYHRHFVEDHLNFFSIQTLSNLLTNTGFTVIDHYYPTRHMSVSHLIRRWGREFLPKRMANALQDSLKATSLWERTIGLNFGDIITVMARKSSTCVC